MYFTTALERLRYKLMNWRVQLFLAGIHSQFHNYTRREINAGSIANYTISVSLLWVYLVYTPQEVKQREIMT